MCVCVPCFVCVCVSDFCLARGLLQFKLPSPDCLSIVPHFPGSNFLSLFPSLHFCPFLVARRGQSLLSLSLSLFLSLSHPPQLRNNCPSFMCAAVTHPNIFCTTTFSLSREGLLRILMFANTPGSVITFSWICWYFFDRTFGFKIHFEAANLPFFSFFFPRTTINAGEPCNAAACFFPSD